MKHSNLCTLVITAILVSLAVCAPLSAQRTPTYLNDLPTENRVKATIIGTDDMDTAARQAGAFWQLRQVIYSFALKQGRSESQVTDDEKRLADVYYLAYYGPWLHVQRMVPENNPRFAKLQSYASSPEFLSEVLQKTTTPNFAAQYYSAMGIQAAHVQAGTAPVPSRVQPSGGGAQNAGAAARTQEEPAVDALAQVFSTLFGAPASGSVNSASSGSSALQCDTSVAWCSLLKKGDEYFAAKDYARAIATYKQVVASRPDTGNASKAYNSMGIAYTSLSQWADALPAFQQSTLLDPKHVNPRYNLGITYVQLKQPDNAIAAFRDVLRLQPNHAEASNRLGVVLANQGKQQDAIAAFQSAIKSKPDFVEPYGNLGNSYLASQQNESALSAYREALRLKGDQPGVAYGMGRASYNLKNYSDAATAFQMAIRDNPNDSQRHYWLGLSYQQLKQHESAIASLQQAAGLNPADADVANQLGINYSSAGRYAEAAAQYQQATRLRPASGVFQFNLGAAYTNLKQYGEAVAPLKEAIRLTPSDPDPYNQLGVVYYRLKQYGDAAPMFQEAIRLKHSNLALSYQNLGLAYVGMGKKDEALQAYKALLPLDKNLAQPLMDSINKMAAPATK